MSTITQEKPLISNTGSEGNNNLAPQNYPKLPSDEVMVNELVEARTGNLREAVKEDQATDPNEESPFIVDPKQEERMLPSPKDVEGSLVITGIDKYAKSK